MKYLIIGMNGFVGTCFINKYYIKIVMKFNKKKKKN